MANFHANNSTAGTQQAQTSTYITLLELLANTTGLRRFHIFGYTVFPAAAPASSDTNLEYDIPRITATGTGTAFTPTTPDSAEGVSSATCKVNDTVEPTVTASSQVKYGGGNQRVTVTFQTNDFSQMLHSPATTANGFAVRSRSLGYTGKVGCAVDYME